MKAVISIAARMSSTRFPGKVMADVMGRPMLSYMLERLTRTRDAEVVVATSAAYTDRPIIALASEMGVRVVTGSESDLMSRHAQVAHETSADVLCLAGADDPLLDPFIFERVLAEFSGRGPGWRYVKTAGWPLGLNVWAWHAGWPSNEANWTAEQPDEREHVVPYFERRPVKHPPTVINRPGGDLYDTYRLTVDNASDLELIRRIYAVLYPRNPLFSAEDVIALLDANPELAAINADGLRGTAAREAIYSIEPIEEAVTA